MGTYVVDDELQVSACAKPVFRKHANADAHVTAFGTPVVYNASEWTGSLSSADLALERSRMGLKPCSCPSVMKCGSHMHWKTIRAGRAPSRPAAEGAA